MREADKPVLANEIWSRANQHVSLPSNATFVLDGGFLLFKLNWKKGETFKIIFQNYLNYILKHYGERSVVVFDGYPDMPTTKDTTHLRRKLRKSGRSVNVSPLMRLAMTKESFQSILKNKDVFKDVFFFYCPKSQS